MGDERWGNEGREGRGEAEVVSALLRGRRVAHSGSYLDLPIQRGNRAFPRSGMAPSFWKLTWDRGEIILLVEFAVGGGRYRYSLQVKHTI